MTPQIEEGERRKGKEESGICVTATEESGGMSRSGKTQYRTRSTVESGDGLQSFRLMDQLSRTKCSFLATGLLESAIFTAVRNVPLWIIWLVDAEQSYNLLFDILFPR